MNQLEKILKWVSIILGAAGLGFFIFDLVLFENLRPRMVAFETLTQTEENLFLLTGAGLLLFMGFCLTTLLRTVNHIRRARQVLPIYLGLIVGGVISLIFIFSDIALLSDIVKQYRFSLAQPEWILVYGIMGFQAIFLLISLYFHIVQFKQADLTEKISLDHNIFLTVQFVGVLCGLMGLAMASLGYIFQKAWKLTVHTTATMIILLFPYGLSVVYWFFVKWRGKEDQLYDEKQSQDIGKSAFLTLTFTTVCMTGLFILNYKNLNGVTSQLWLPIYLFLVLFVFSLGNIYFSWKES